MQPLQFNREEAVSAVVLLFERNATRREVASLVKKKKRKVVSFS